MISTPNGPDADDSNRAEEVASVKEDTTDNQTSSEVSSGGEGDGEPIGASAGAVRASAPPGEVERACGAGFVGKITTNLALHRFSSSVRHIKLFAPDRKLSLSVVDVSTTERYGHQKITVAGLQRNGKIILASQQCDIEFVEQPTVDIATGYGGCCRLDVAAHVFVHSKPAASR